MFDGLVRKRARFTASRRDEADRSRVSFCSAIELHPHKARLIVQARCHTPGGDDSTVHPPGPPTIVGAVPEPATWATMLFGFGLVGGMLRRRRSILA